MHLWTAWPAALSWQLHGSFHDHSLHWGAFQVLQYLDPRHLEMDVLVFHCKRKPMVARNPLLQAHCSLMLMISIEIIVNAQVCARNLQLPTWYQSLFGGFPDCAGQ